MKLLQWRRMSGPTPLFCTRDIKKVKLEEKKTIRKKQNKNIIPFMNHTCWSERSCTFQAHLDKYTVKVLYLKLKPDKHFCNTLWTPSNILTMALSKNMVYFTVTY